eukprot:SAG22_NODE_475_length_10003_cov_3.943356_10_plen_214_part_00
MPGRTICPARRYLPGMLGFPKPAGRLFRTCRACWAGRHSNLCNCMLCGLGSAQLMPSPAAPVRASMRLLVVGIVAVDLQRIVLDARPVFHCHQAPADHLSRIGSLPRPAKAAPLRCPSSRRPVITECGADVAATAQAIALRQVRSTVQLYRTAGTCTVLNLVPVQLYRTCTWTDRTVPTVGKYLIISYTAVPKYDDSWDQIVFEIHVPRQGLH